MPAVDVRKLGGVRATEMAARFGLGAAVSIVAGIVSLAAGARLGGVFLAFPAILPASLTFVQNKEGTRVADHDALGAVLGGTAGVVFATVGESMFGRHNSALVLGMALAGWLLTAILLYGVLNLLRPDTEDRRSEDE